MTESVPEHTPKGPIPALVLAQDNLFIFRVIVAGRRFTSK